MTIRPEQPQTIGGVLDTTFQLYKKSIGKVWLLCLIGAIGGALPSLYMAMTGAGTPSNPTAVLAMIGSPGWWGMYVIAMLLSLWTMAACYRMQEAIGTDSPMTLAGALTSSASRLPILFLTMILFGIAVTVGMLLLVIPGLILMVSLLLCFTLVVLEDKGPVDSLTGSHRLIWGNWWRTTAILTVGFAIAIVLYVAIGLVIGIVIPIVGIGSTNPLLFGMITGLVVGVLAALLLTPFYIALLLAVYWDLKLRKEGGDLAARVGALGTA